MSVSSISCPCCKASVSVSGDAGTCAACKAAIEVFDSIEVARTTAEYRENARVSPVPESNLWIVAVSA